MKYKNYTFPHEPERLEIRVRNRLGLAHCPGYGPAIQELGVGERVIMGEGAFFGAKAGEQYRRLEEIFFQQTPGLLVLPGHTAVQAHFSRLGWLGEGDGGIIRYSFEFIERPSAYWEGKDRRYP